MVVIGLLLALAAPAAWYAQDAAEVDAVLRGWHAEHGAYTTRLEAIVRASLGTPYADGPLGEGPAGEHDTDPLIDLTRVDGGTFVAQTAAVAKCDAYDAATAFLQGIRYADGEIGFARRNHFMIADWVRNNAWVADITAKLGVATESLTRTISKRDFFERVKAPGLGEDTPDKPVTIQYIPTADVAEAEPRFPKLALVVFIGKVEWLFALHCGWYVREEGGAGKLFHASSKAGKVVAVDLHDYLAEQEDRYLGIAVYAVTEPGG